MIGNDIVDLAQAQKESNWRRKGYVDKVFTPHEQQLICTASDPDRMVWLLWSMKESAYKIAVRYSGKRRFAPLKLACYLTDMNTKNAKGIVFSEAEYLTQSSLTEQYIATVATSKNNSPKHTIVPLKEIDYPYQHHILWQKVKQQCALALSLPEEKIYFYRDEVDAPWVVLSSAKKIPLSLSHHGRFGAFVIGKCV